MGKNKIEMSSETKRNPNPTLMYKNFGLDVANSHVGSTLVKTCPSGNVDRDNLCGIDAAWTNMYTAPEQLVAKDTACCLRLTFKSNPAYMTSDQINNSATQFKSGIPRD